MLPQNNKQRNPLVFLDLAIDGEKAGRIVCELRSDVVPRTAENFRALCTGERGIGVNGKPLHYKGCKFHKAIAQFMVQTGDIVNNDGTGGESIYGPTFEDENFILKHEVGSLSMANAGRPHTNGSQFCVTTVPCAHLDGSNVVFARVASGLALLEEVQALSGDDCRPAKVTKETVNVDSTLSSHSAQFCVTTVPCAHLDGSNVVFARVASGLALLEEVQALTPYLLIYGLALLEEVQALSGDDCRPAKECTIQSCGELDQLPADGVRCDDGTCDRLPEYPADYHRQDTPLELLGSITDTKTSGNGYFESGRYQMAIRKYNKCIRYLDRVKEMLDQLDSSPEIESGQNVTLTYRLQCHLNLAACHLKLLEYADCIKQCNEVLFHDPRNGKALYRRAQANFTLANYESAIEDLRKAVEISPHNKAVQKLLEEVTLTNKHYTGVQKQRLSKFFREQRQETVVGNPTH
ncbi:unnamed protein product [Plutella xylostella]|uniref:peptidylprolyl isomerase n=1 Tax=Plutella xylostella TaxID=51655 RepID=A0A8S4FMX4_PLUXY|nr:unnamed protein product [Plutella xylostella]